MSERTAEQIRTEIAAERQRLEDDLDALQAEVRSLVPYVVGAVVVFAVLTGGRGLRTGSRLIWKLL